jgi:hypothetical protein
VIWARLQRTVVAWRERRQARTLERFGMSVFRAEAARLEGEHDRQERELADLRALIQAHTFRRQGG